MCSFPVTLTIIGVKKELTFAHITPTTLPILGLIIIDNNTAIMANSNVFTQINGIKK